MRNIQALFHYHTPLVTRMSPPPVAKQPLLGEGHPNVEDSRLHSDTPHTVALFYMSDQPVEETSTGQYTTLTRDRHPCSSAGFEPTILANEQPQTHPLVRAATGIG